MHLIHADLYVSSMEKSLEFYVARLGFSVVRDTIIAGDLPRNISGGSFDSMRLVLLSSSPGSAGLELVQFQGVSRDAGFRVIPHQGSVSFLVEDLRALVASLQGMGIQTENEIATVVIPRIGRSEIVFVRDPDGHSIELTQVMPISVF